MNSYPQLIGPVTFAAAVESAISYMEEGYNISSAVGAACAKENISEEWILPLIGFLDSSPTAAEAWARTVYKAGAERVGQKLDTSSMEPRENPRQPIFRDHNCWACKDGELPCREGNYGTCSYPHARND